jgi:hypothetical protein
LAPGGSATVLIGVQPQSCGLFRNEAFTTATETDINEANNTAFADTECTVGLAVGDPIKTIPGDEAFDDDVTTVTTGTLVGWGPFTENTPGRITLSYDAVNKALRAHVFQATNGYSRISGWMTGNSEWLPYGCVGSENYVRGKFYMFTGGHADPGNLNQVPNMRLRLSNRFAVNSMLEVFNHLAGDAPATLLGRDLRPSTDPANPSLYRVDFDPVDVPYLMTAGEGILRAFEAYSLENQENGDVELTESVIGRYPAACLPDVSPSKVYAPTGSDAGDLKIVNSASDLQLKKLIPGTVPGQPAVESTTNPGVGIPTYAEGPFGITLDSSGVGTGRIGLGVREFQTDSDPTARLRVEPGKQYKLRWHVTSANNSNINSQMRLRGRAIRFMWSQKYEVGGAFNVRLFQPSNIIASQALPGVGTLNPDKNDAEDGGWYTMWMHTPMSADIRASQPAIGAEPGPGVNASSARDLRIGFDLVDTLSSGQGKELEKGNFTVDRVEIFTYDLVPD